MSPDVGVAVLVCLRSLFGNAVVCTIAVRAAFPLFNEIGIIDIFDIYLPRLKSLGRSTISLVQIWNIF